MAQGDAFFISGRGTGGQSETFSINGVLKVTEAKLIQDVKIEIDEGSGYRELWYEPSSNLTIDGGAAWYIPQGTLRLSFDYDRDYRIVGVYIK